MLVTLLCTLFATQAWAEDADVTYDFTGDDWYVSDGTLTDGSVSFTGAGGANFKMNVGYFFLGKSGAYLNFPTYSSPVKKIVITGKSGASGSVAQNIYVGDVAVSTATTGATGTNTYEIATDYQDAGTQYTLKISSNHNTQITKIEIFFASSSGGGGTTEKNDCDLALTGTTDLEFDLYNDADAKVINYTTSSTGTVTVVNSEYINAVVGEGTITVTPLKKTNGEVEITVNQAADDDYKAGSATFTVTIDDSTPKTGAWELTSLADLGQDDVFIIVGTNGSNYAMANDNGTGSAPAAVSVTIEDDVITSDVEDNMKWNISGNATDGYTFYPDGDDEKWLYCNTTASTSSNNNMRVGTGDRKVFVMSNNNYLVTKDDYTARYVSVYSGSDWRGYVNTTTAPTTLTFYKYVDGTAPQKANPELSFSSATAEATFGQQFTAPTLNTADGFNGSVEYTSSVETVAQVMDAETGELRIVGGGTTIITATFDGNDDFKSGSASYTLTVTDNRIATTVIQDNIVLEVADVATLTRLAPVVKDADDNVIPYAYDEWPTEMSFEIVSDEKGLIGSIDNNTGEITLNSVTGTATLKASYNLYNVNSTYKPSECTFTITVESTLNGIAEFCSLESGNTGTVRLTDAVVLYVNGKDIFVRDNTGAIDFYNTGLTYEAGNILNGKITAKYTLYNGMDELTTPISNNTLVATTGSAVTPTEITTSDAADNTCNLVKLSGVTVTSSNSKFYVGDVQVYDKFKLNYAIEEGKTYDIVGIMIPYNSIYEICPTEAPVEIVVATPTITLEQYEYILNSNGGDAELPVTTSNLADDPQLAVVFCDANGDAVADGTYDWITASINNSGNIAGHIDVNTTSDDRTAYFKVSGKDANDNTVYSELVTITQTAANPSITFEKSSIDFAFGGESDRKMSFEYESLGNNPTFEVVFFEQDGTTPATYDWVTSATIEDNKVNLSVEANDGEARTAYFKVHAKGTEIYSNLVTINQAKFVVDYATLPFYWAGGAKDDFQALNGVTANGLGSDYAASNAPYRIKFDTTGDYIQIKTNEQPRRVSVDVKMLGGAATSSITVQESSDGITFSDVEELEISGKQNDVLNLQTTNAFDADTRYVRLYFNKGSNVGVGAISMMKPVTLNGSGYATYACKYALDFSTAEADGYTAWQITSIDNNAITFSQVEGAVAAGTGVLLKGTAGDEIFPTPVATGDELTDNMLVGITYPTLIDADTYYGLSGNKFVRVAATTIPAGKALLPASAIPTNARDLTFFFEGETTGIHTVENGQSSIENGNWYTLGGQKMNGKPATKGIYIVNGKKIVVK